MARKYNGFWLSMSNTSNEFIYMTRLAINNIHLKHITCKLLWVLHVFLDS